LQKQGLVVLGAEGWHRSRKLEITKKGRAKVEEGTPLWEKAQNALKRKLGDRNWSAVHESLEQLIEKG
jgi:DNA-binding MarR family transcriptional regulator